MAESEQVITVEDVTADSVGRSPRALSEIILSQLEALKTHHRAVLESDKAEAIHKMRVTTRRAQAAIDLLGREPKVRAAKRLLRNWRRRLSLVRNYDVFLMLLEKESQARRAAHREQFQLVTTMLQKRRAHRAAKVKEYFEKIDISSIPSKLGMSATAPQNNTGEGAAADETNAIEESLVSTIDSSPLFDRSRIAGYAAKRLDQRLAEFYALAAAAHPTTDPAELHQLRIAAKRVRYLLEVVTEMGYGDATRALAWLKTLQDRIGDWHDLHALEEEIIEVVSRRRFMKEHLSESSRMLQVAAHLQKKKEALVAKLFPVRAPRTLALTAQRIARALRRDSLRAGAGVKRTGRFKNETPQPQNNNPRSNYNFTSHN
ncbi:MAG TPA: CHAD domain-containing protein [Blastocatellia bacterium]|nr:CHAD domain-containing protein [Blastocatellia bacterium]